MITCFCILMILTLTGYLYHLSHPAITITINDSVCFLIVPMCLEHSLTTPCKEWFANPGAKICFAKRKYACDWASKNAQSSYTWFLNKSYLVTGVKYFHSVTCITMPDKFLNKLWKIHSHTMMEFIGMAEETAKKGSNLCAYTPNFHRHGHTFRSSDYFEDN